MKLNEIFFWIPKVIAFNKLKIITQFLFINKTKVPTKENHLSQQMRYKNVLTAKQSNLLDLFVHIK